MNLAGKMPYSLRHMDALTVVGKKVNAQLFTEAAGMPGAGSANRASEAT